MDWTDVLFLLTLLLYAVASVALLAGYIGRSGRAKGLAAGISLAAFGLHTLLLAVTAAAGWNMVVRSLWLLCSPPWASAPGRRRWPCSPDW